MTSTFSASDPASSTTWSRTPRAIADIMARAAVGVFEAHCSTRCGAAANSAASEDREAPKTLAALQVGIPLADESLAAAVRDIGQSNATHHSPDEHTGNFDANDGHQRNSRQHDNLQCSDLQSEHTQQPTFEIAQECAHPFPIVLLHRAGVENAMMHVRKTLGEAEESASSEIRDALETSASSAVPHLWHMLSDALRNRKSPDEAALLVAEALMDPMCGVAALLLSVRMSYGSVGNDLRTCLLERNLVDAVIEMDAEALKAHTHGGNAIWFLRANRAENEKVLLAQLSGDGFVALEGTPKFYESLSQPATALSAGGAILDLYVNHTEVPLVSTLVSRERILADRECNVRFSSYADSVDLRRDISQGSKAWQVARAEMQSRAQELEKRIQAFNAALDALA